MFQGSFKLMICIYLPGIIRVVLDTDRLTQAEIAPKKKNELEIFIHLMKVGEEWNSCTIKQTKAGNIKLPASAYNV